MFAIKRKKKYFDAKFSFANSYQLKHISKKKKKNYENTLKTLKCMQSSQFNKLFIDPGNLVFYFMKYRNLISFCRFISICVFFTIVLIFSPIDFHYTQTDCVRLLVLLTVPSGNHNANRWNKIHCQPLGINNQCVGKPFSVHVQNEKWYKLIDTARHSFCFHAICVLSILYFYMNGLSFL